jgi:hypothetical protein
MMRILRQRNIDGKLNILHILILFFLGLYQFFLWVMLFLKFHQILFFADGNHQNGLH